MSPPILRSEALQTWVKSRWKLLPLPGQLSAEINNGVFSWIPPEAQEGVFSILKENLASDGVAFVSYNVLPGWHMRNVVRDVLKFHVDQADDPAHQVSQGRTFLGQLAQIVPESTPYGQLLRHEAAGLATMPDSYILGEFLSEVNAPCHFHEFVARANAAGLAHVVDLDLHAQRIQLASPELVNALSQLGGGDPVLTDQYLDILQGRQFRQSLLVRNQASESLRRMPELDRDSGLYFGSRLRVSGGKQRDGAFVVRDPNGRSITTNDPMAAKALDYLGASSPENRDLRAILSELEIADAGDLEAVTRRVLSTLLQLVIAGLATVSTAPVKAGRGTDLFPKAWPLARAELQSGQSWLTNLLHAPVKLDPVGIAVFPWLDGSRNIETIAHSVAESQKNVSGGAMNGWPRDRIIKAVEQSLLDFERLALLVATEAHI